jgi:integrase
VKKIAPATVNKLLGSIQALVVWSRNNGLIPDDVPWADPFSDMRLEEAPSEREPWQPEELQMLFGSPVYTEGARPTGGRGEAAFWLPLLGLYTGARLNELAPLGAADVTTDKATGIAMITIKEDLEEGRRLKTVGSRRSVPVHPELLRIGFRDFVDHVRERNAANGRLFPLSRLDRREASGRHGRSGSGATSEGLASRTRPASSIRSGTASRMPCGPQGSPRMSMTLSVDTRARAAWHASTAPRTWSGASPFRGLPTRSRK